MPINVYMHPGDLGVFLNTTPGPKSIIYTPMGFDFDFLRDKMNTRFPGIFSETLRIGAMHKSVESVLGMEGSESKEIIQPYHILTLYTDALEFMKKAFKEGPEELIRDKTTCLRVECVKWYSSNSKASYSIELDTNPPIIRMSYHGAESPQIRDFIKIAKKRKVPFVLEHAPFYQGYNPMR